MGSRGVEDVWTIVLLFKGSSTPFIRKVTRVEASCYDVGSLTADGVDEVIVLRTGVNSIEISWKVARRG